MIRIILVKLSISTALLLLTVLCTAAEQRIRHIQ